MLLAWGGADLGQQEVIRRRHGAIWMGHNRCGQCVLQALFGGFRLQLLPLTGSCIGPFLVPAWSTCEL